MTAFKNKVSSVYYRFTALLSCFAARIRSVKTTLANNEAEGFVDTGIKILISVVIGALLLSGLYALFGNTILPTLTQKIQELFDYAG